MAVDLGNFVKMNELRAMLREIAPNAHELRRLDMIAPREGELPNADRAAHLFWIAAELRRVAAAAASAADAFTSAGVAMAMRDGRTAEQAECLRAQCTQTSDPR